MTNDANTSNTARRSLVTTRRSDKMRHEVSQDRHVVSHARGGSTGPLKPDTLVSAKAHRLIKYGADVGGPNANFELRFRTSLGGCITVEVPGPSLLKPDRVIEQVIAEHGLFPADPVSLKADVEGCVTQEVATVTRTAITGWKGAGAHSAFITPAGAFGPGAAEHEFATVQDHVSINGEVGAQKGSLKEWRRSVGRYVEMSSAGRVLLGSALAAPLLRSAGLGESWMFLLAAKSTTGKTTLLNGVSSFQGSGNPVSPRTSDRRFNELAAKHNGLLFVIGDLSQLNQSDRRRVLHWMVMDATSGQPRSVSRAVKATLPDLPFETIAASSAEQTAAEIANGAGVQQLVGERVRGFDLMPGVNGYFDVRPKAKKLRPETIVGRINEGAQRQYGTALRAWIEWLAGHEEASLEAQVGELMDAFVAKLDQHGDLSGLERRAARKFGLIYAGLVLGREAKITRLSSNQAFKSVRICFNRAMASTAAASPSPEAALKAFRQALSSPGSVVRAFQGQAAVKAAIRRNPDWLAVETKRDGQRVIGLRPSAVRKAIGKARAQIAFGTLTEGGWLRMPKGTKRWQKKIPGCGKVRLVELKPEWFDKT